MVGIVTGTIKPPAQMSQLNLRDTEERLRQYKDSLIFLIDSGAFSKIVFCENNGYDMELLSDLTAYARDKNIRLELLSFQGNTEKICVQGKGYGEGEAMSYVFSQSKLAAGEPYFVKITGRLKVDNIKGIVERLHPEKTYFNIPNRTIRDLYDTRIYGMPTEQFQRLFLKAYEQVMDQQGIFLERVYTRVIQENQIRVTNFPRYPRIVGVSGSGGAVYGYTEWKCKIKDLFSRMNLYKVR